MSPEAKALWSKTILLQKTDPDYRNYARKATQNRLSESLISYPDSAAVSLP